MLNYGNDPRREVNRIRRKQFEALKRTEGFKRWKSEQWQVQSGRCAWCRQAMRKDMSNVHVDHALALFHEGRNDYSNLVLSHGKCNMRKYIRIDGVPQWVINARSRYKPSATIKVQEKIMRRAVRDELDMQTLDYLRTWI